MRLLSGFLVLATISLATADSVPLSPTALVVSPEGKMLYVACATANRVLCFDTAERKVTGFFSLPESPSGLVLSSDGTKLFVTCAAPESKICIINLKKKKVVETISAGHTAMAPVLSPDGKSLYVCNRFNNDVSVIDLAKKKELRRIAVQREPVAAAITRDGKYLLVANHLHNGRADVDYVAAVLSVADLATGKVVKDLQLPNGSGSLKDVCISPDGKYAAVTHVVARFNRPATHLAYGWMNVNAMTLIDLARMEIYNTVLLDNLENGAANPWGIAWPADSTTLVITHAGTHEISVIDFPTLMAHLLDIRTTFALEKTADPSTIFRTQPELADDLPFLAGSRQRVKTPKTDFGPRAVAIVGHTVYVANYFSDTLSVIDLSTPKNRIESIPLGPKPEMSIVCKGEFYFHDATICFQGWQSCSSCHPGDARADGLNWDLPNDGLGNPKNTKNLLLAHKTPPAMSLGVRATAETAVRAGIQHILFTKQPEEVADSIDEYLKSLKPVPSPYLHHGKLSKAAKRGEKVFTRAGCEVCHSSGLYTDLHPHDVGTHGQHDRTTDKFYTPTLIEVWRTAPYLHDGSAATMCDVVTTRNPHDEHGETSKLSQQDIDDLCEYVLSL